MEKIDELDKKILRIITQNARIPFKDVADKCGVSRAAIHQRVSKLFEDKVITGSGYQVDPRELGYNLCVFVGIMLEKGNMYDSVCAELEKIPEVVCAFYTLGKYSMMVKVYARNDAHLMQILNGQIQSIHGVANTETLTALDEKFNRQLPID